MRKYYKDLTLPIVYNACMTGFVLSSGLSVAYSVTWPQNHPL